MALNKAMSWTLMSMAISTVMRLGSTVILGHVLLPYDFGLAALIFAIVFGIEMMTDGGAVMSLMRSKRTDDAWLDTVWSFQITRAALIVLLCIVLAKPVAIFFGDDSLTGMMMVIGLLPLFDAMASTSANMAVRNLDLKRYSIAEILSLLFSYSITLPIAIYYQSAWAMVLGGVASGLGHFITSFTMFPKRKHTFRFEKEALKELLGFGLWLMFTSAIGFAIFQGDKLITGRALGVAELGLYSIAVMWSSALADLTMRFILRIFVPVFSHVYRADGHTGRIAKIRMQILLAILLPVAAISSLGVQIINMIYPPAMEPAGPILQILIIGLWFSVLETLYQHQFLVEGKSDRRFYAQIASLIVLAVLVLSMWGQLTIMKLALIFLTGGVVRTIVMAGMANFTNLSRLLPDAALTAAFLGLVYMLSWCTQWLTGIADLAIILGMMAAIALPSGALAWHALRQANRWYAQES